MADSTAPPPARVSAQVIEVLERRAAEGWPALETADVAGWQLGRSGRYTRRANCVLPFAASGRERQDARRSALDAQIDRVEAWFGERGLPAVFKLTAASRPAALEAALAERGYLRRDETVTQELMLEAIDRGATGPGRAPAEPGAAARELEVVTNRIGAQWWDASCEGSGVAPARRDDYRALLDRSIAGTDAALFGSARVEGRIVAVALGNVVGGCVHLVQVATLEVARGRQHAEAVLRAILFAAREYGVDRAQLSVEASNASARRLYARIGFAERYRYVYRESPAR